MTCIRSIGFWKDMGFGFFADSLRECIKKLYNMSLNSFEAKGLAASGFSPSYSTPLPFSRKVRKLTLGCQEAGEDSPTSP
jgi:hypothetical protein